MQKWMYVYIMTNANQTTLYTGVTNDLARRVYQHRQELVSGFTKRYNITSLVNYEVFDDPPEAIRREKQIKAGSRARKEKLIENINSGWMDLYEKLLDGSL